MKSSMELIEKIHAEFDSATERTLKMAETIINGAKTENVVQDEDVRTLEKLGFVSNPMVMKYKQKSGEIFQKNASIEENKKTAERVAEFINNMSYYRVISYAQTMRICEKYGLYLGQAKRFKGEIPKKNLKEIAEYKNNGNGVDLSHNKPLFYADKGLASPFYVVAPKSHFDFYGAQIVGREIFDYNKKTVKQIMIERKPVQDPVVLYPMKCKGMIFFHIVSKWGIEAEINEFKNPLDN